MFFKVRPSVSNDTLMTTRGAHQTCTFELYKGSSEKAQAAIVPEVIKNTRFSTARTTSLFSTDGSRRSTALVDAKKIPPKVSIENAQMCVLVEPPVQTASALTRCAHQTCTPEPAKKQTQPRHQNTGFLLQGRPRSCQSIDGTKATQSTATEAQRHHPSMH